MVEFSRDGGWVTSSSTSSSSTAMRAAAASAVAELRVGPDGGGARNGEQWDVTGLDHAPSGQEFVLVVEVCSTRGDATTITASTSTSTRSMASTGIAIIAVAGMYI